MNENHHAGSGLQRALERLSYDAGFVASAYRDWSGEQVDLSRIAKKLTTDLDTIIQVGLCRRPWASSPSFASDVTKIAIYGRLCSDAFMEFLREAEALRAFRMGSSGDGLLAAARDQHKAELGDDDAQ